MAKHASDTSAMELSHYATVLRRRWKVVVIGVAAGITMAVGVIVATPASATAATSVQVNLISSTLFNTARPPSDLVDAETEQAMARSTTVTSAVAEELGGSWTRTAVRRATTATLLPDSTLLRIEFTAPTAQEASIGASLVAEEYLTYRSDLAQGRVDLATEPLKARSDSLQKRLGQANRKVGEAVPGSPDQVAAEVQVDEIRSELATVTSQINELASVTTSGGIVVTEADPGQVATHPNRKLILLSGALGGVLIGLLAAFVANVLDRRIRDAYDVAGAGGGDVVGHLEGSAVELPPSGHDADQLRALRERLLAAVDAERPVFGVIEVGSTSDAPSDTGIGLALALADAGVVTEVLLVDHDQAVVEATVAALGAREIETHGRGRRFVGGVADTLTVVVPGSPRARVAVSDLVAELLDEEARASEVTVVAVGPGAGSAVRLTVGRGSDQVVFVVREDATLIDRLAELSTELQAVWATLHGSVLIPRTRAWRSEEGDSAPAAPIPAGAPASSEPALASAATAPAAEAPATAAAEGADAGTGADEHDGLAAPEPPSQPGPVDEPEPLRDGIWPERSLAPEAPDASGQSWAFDR